ncbi:MAG TPA: PEP/pyruvate-binding domain-containing protein [Verrucomicrobiota bacterium]|nr:PEP/pyruvate-binding domain-containing protein [Verrucomicrobiota bacterium]HNU53200.1 PEP/pyruvate-binding domain-containing protein [Verrucomicrobiota bacterium]
MSHGRRLRHVACGLMAALAGGTVAAQPSLSITATEPDGALCLEAQSPPGHVAVLQASADLADWAPIHATAQPSWSWIDDESPLATRRYYRLSCREPRVITPSDTWKNRISLWDDPFWDHENVHLVPNPLSDVERINWIKFTLFLDDPTVAYFQDTSVHKLHYSYCTAYLDPFLGMEPAAYDRATLQRDTQLAVIGSVLFDPDANEYGIQFAGLDPYPREMARFLYETVDRAIDKPAGAAGFYMPSYEQTDSAFREAAYFASHQVPLATTQRWLAGEDIYGYGWAIGRLVWVPGSQIDGAYRAGQLTHEDILLTDEVPSELPYLAGIVTFSASTPNSHVAILARSYAVPFVHATAAALTNRLEALRGQRVFLRAIEPVDRRDLRPKITVMALPALDPAFEAEMMSLKRAPELELRPKAHYGAYSAAVGGLTPADVCHVGGKAAHFGFLRRVVPDHAPDPAVAFTFDLWDEFLEQPLPSGATLAVEIARRLEGYAYPPDLVALSRDLKAIRDLIVDTADFNADQKAAILAALEPFDPDRRIRFRSSTNVEDTELFSGAGLYDSYSGCLRDDLDGDDLGPCACDPERETERGVFLVMRKVYASFYNDNAVLERLRHRVDEHAVGMAVLAHYSSPDAMELANGVATACYSRSGDTARLQTTMVTQPGAVSVTNPEGQSLPEVADVDSWRSVTNSQTLRLTQRSSLLPAGEDHVLAWEDEYRAFQGMFFDLAEAYAAYWANKEAFTLDIEYKKIAPGWLVIKQLRELPSPPAPKTAPILLNEPLTLQVSQGPRASLFAHHRLKSLWTVETDNRWLDATGQATCFLIRTDWSHTLDGGIATQTGPLSSWTGVQHVLETNDTTWSVDRWTRDTVHGPVAFAFRVSLPKAACLAQCPVFTLRDLELRLQADYASPQMIYDSWYDRVAWTTNDVVVLEPAPAGEAALPSATTKTCAAGGGLNVEIVFYYKPEDWPQGMTGYTPTVWRFEETAVAGLLPGAPIVLRSYWSQTCQTFHKPYFGDLLFEPGLDPEVAPAVLEDLEAADIRIIFLRPERPWEQPAVKVIGLDGALRDWP